MVRCFSATDISHHRAMIWGWWTICRPSTASGRGPRDGCSDAALDLEGLVGTPLQAAGTGKLRWQHGSWKHLTGMSLKNRISRGAIFAKNNTRCKPSKTAYSGCFGTPGATRTHYVPLRSLAYQSCVLLYFLYSFFSFHIMLYGGYT